MRLSNLVSFIGFVIVIVGTFCPLLRPVPLVVWDVYQCNQPYGIVILLVTIVGIIGTVFGRQGITNLMAWFSLILVALFLLLAWLKVHTSFGFIPFQSWENYMIKHVRYKWGWYMLFAGAIMALVGALSGKKRSIAPANAE